MEIEFVTGIPKAIFANFVSFKSSEQQKNIAYVIRNSADVQNYLESAEFIESYTFAGIVATLGKSGYKRVTKVSELGEFAVMGDTITLWLPGLTDPVRFSFFGDELEEISSYDALTGRRLRIYKNFPIFDLRKLVQKADWDNIYFTADYSEFMDKGLVLLTKAEANEQTSFSSTEGKFQLVSSFDLSPLELYFNRLDLLEQKINDWQKKGFSIYISTQHTTELSSTLKKYAKEFSKAVETSFNNSIPLSDLDRVELGFLSEKYKFVLITDRELFGTVFVSSRRHKGLKSSEAQKLLSQLEGEIELGDYIVHEDYGVAVYKGFETEEGSDYLLLEYAEADELYVPLDQIDKLTKYIGEGDPEITRLGQNQWQRISKKVKKQVAIAAKDLARHYAQSKLATALAVDELDSEEYKSFLQDFEFEPTPDQLRAEKEIISDLSKRKPMNRLLIGDVGFGKTEVMMRAAFKICETGAQVVILCPTTVLALQHFNSFRQRFAGRFSVGLLSRYNSPQKNKELVEKVGNGEIDIVVGTHRILSSDFKPKQMGLLIVDEEQRFGVKQKEKIRKLEYGVHALFVSATPIPRTLSMALSAIQDISMINTPPQGRKMVITDVDKLDWNKVTLAIRKEVERGGQVFFVHNQVKTIDSVRARLLGLLPDISFVIGHGQMPAKKLDEVVTQFYQKKYDCLIATTIIENGIDMPNVNTLIVNNAQNFGLAQMYQLRGRVGRSERQAYAYFFYKGRSLPADQELSMQFQEESDDVLEKGKLKPAKYLERLETILSSQALGSGFRVASKDLEIRGAGNLLGAKQHGNISKIGYSLYMQMLAEEIEKLKNYEDAGNI